MLCVARIGRGKKLSQDVTWPLPHELIAAVVIYTRLGFSTVHCGRGAPEVPPSPDSQLTINGCIGGGIILRGTLAKKYFIL